MTTIDPTHYLLFYAKLLDRFIEIEHKGDISKFARKTSRDIWQVYDDEHLIERAIFLFKPRDIKDFSAEYFWNRNLKAKKYKRLKQDFKINTEAFGKALEYIGFKIGNEYDNRSYMVRTPLLYEEFKNFINSLPNSVINNVEKTTAKKTVIAPIEEKLRNRRFISSFDFEEDGRTITIERMYITEKQDGTDFLEHEIEDIITPPKEKLTHGILFLDIDDLTIINKKFGISIGDTVLIETKEILLQRGAFNYGGRCGDDTFFCIFLNTDELSFLQSCKKIMGGFGFKQWKLIAHKLRVTGTIGYAFLKENEDMRSWIQRAAIGLVYGKESSKQSIQPGPLHLSKKDLVKKERSDSISEIASQHFREFTLREWFS